MRMKRSNRRISTQSGTNISRNRKSRRRQKLFRHRMNHPVSARGAAQHWCCGQPKKATALEKNSMDVLHFRNADTYRTSRNAQRTCENRDRRKTSYGKNQNRMTPECCDPLRSLGVPRAAKKLAADLQNPKIKISGEVTVVWLTEPFA